MKFSVVTTLYNSANYLKEFHSRTVTALGKIGVDYEMIFVNDGSPDNSLAVALEIQLKDPKIVIVDLSRNFGHHPAIMTGLSEAKGEYIFLIDCDLEEDPELIVLFWDTIINVKDTDIVFGVQKNRKGKWFEKISGWLFYTIFNFFSQIKIPKNLSTVRLMTRRYVNQLIRHEEKELVLAGIMSSTGFNQVPIYITKKHRGATNYNFTRKTSLLINSIISFSNKPLIYVSFLGIIITIISFVFILFLIYRKFTNPDVAIGWTSIFVSVWFVGGIIIFSIGILGMYLSKIFIEIKNRPLTIIKSIFKNIQL